MKFPDCDSTPREWAIYWQKVAANLQKKVILSRAGKCECSLWHLEGAAEAYKLARWWVTQIEK